MSYYNDDLRGINGLRLLGVQYFQSFMNIDIIMFVLFISYYPLQRKKGISYQTKQTRKHIKVLNKTFNTTLPF